MISSISQASTPSTTTLRKSGSSTAITVEQITEAQAHGGATFEDPALGSATIVDLSKVPKPIEQFSELRRAQNTEAGRSMETIKNELGKIESMIAKRRPEIAGKWDFQLVDGKLKVTGLNAGDAKWLESKLNANTSLKAAAEAFVATALENLQASSSNPPRKDLNLVTRKMENYTFYDVKDQLAEKLSFKALLTQSDQVFDSNKISMEAHDRGMSGLAVVANMLTPSNRTIEGRPGPFYTPTYDPLQS
ncbi:hypothetical protein [Roseateles paludis]|jgi:hypothetical protein|uniref:Uncharacterized protein n=1 Tax=Roseateles paludis TaxID=3145238 RepID=A0ABV0FVG5_9BURK